MYIDPNSGGLLFQVLVVIFGLISGMVLVFSSKIKMGLAKFRRILRQKAGDNNTPDSNPETDK